MPPPVTINYPLMFGIGTGLWAVALAVIVILDLTGVYQARVWIWVCAVGTLLGVAGTVYSKFSWRARQN
ncbi:MAG: hypothetical protein LBD77_06145 [Bifidobacteriaceae bacterium]|jgi:hypothetical protein|nr:hypothetical protein [Bifidobacteriaceae bacterium]